MGFFAAMTLTVALVGLPATAYAQTPTPGPMSDPAEREVCAVRPPGADLSDCPGQPSERDQLARTGPREAAVYGATGLGLVGVGGMLLVAGRRRGLSEA